MYADKDPDEILCVLGDEYKKVDADSPTKQAIPIIEKYILRD